MPRPDTVVAVFHTHQAAENAVLLLVESGFDMQALGLVGKAHPVDDTMAGFHTTADRVTFRGRRGAFWGGLWGLFFGGVVLTVPRFGDFVVLGRVAATVVGMLESGAPAGGLGGALSRFGIPEDSVAGYVAALRRDDFLVMADAGRTEAVRARDILAAVNPMRVDVHAKPILAAA